LLEESRVEDGQPGESESRLRLRVMRPDAVRHLTLENVAFESVTLES
jgi:hypothetical protein